MDEISSSPAFPLLKLPYVVLNNVISNFKQREILEFSFVSKKCSSIIKTSNLFRFEIRISFKENLPVVSFTPPGKFTLGNCHIGKDYFETRENYMKVDMNKLSGDVNEKNLQLSLTWADYIFDLYHLNNIAGIYLSSNSSLNKVNTIVEWLNGRIPYPTNFFFYGSETNENGLKLFFDRLNVNIRELSLQLTVVKDLKPFIRRFLDLDRFEAYGKSFTYPIKWITMDYILSSTFKSIYMRYTSFTEMDFNRFIKGWLNGNHSRIESFYADVQQMNPDLVIDGIEVEERVDTVKRVFTG
ncbi:hypothetical protein GCK72_006375 [Caenorhabditis remanei]|uniref:F-box domain-containing protein n=1 Tax=Caenorhabditis remanei TaxID=31234 RepID=A0A6A5HF34_CAERE|nr:hypothetical protein GCK72_006375 [Caenorhabditis remanei]KAF1766418.1 hypothetical protein GCK72_006375 [Caenorhabditis remanei]